MIEIVLFYLLCGLVCHAVVEIDGDLDDEAGEIP